MNKVIDAGYIPREWQANFHKNRKRWNVLVLHRRAGKTNACVIELIKGVIEHENSVFAYISPTYSQSKKVAWKMFKQYLEEFFKNGLVKFNESELKITFYNGAEIYLLGAENPDSLRGMALWGVVFDEYSQQPSNIFSEIIRPALSDKKGWAIWIGTPKGRNDFYDIYEFARGDEDWYDLSLTVSQSNLIDEEELTDVKKTMSEEEYKQEYLCDFDVSIKGAIYGKQLQETKENFRIRKDIFVDGNEVTTFWDLGIADAMSILFVQTINNEIRIVDYFEDTGYGFEYYFDIIRNKGYNYKEHYFPHDIRVRELGTGVSRLELVQKEFGNDKVRVTTNISIEDGINAVRFIFDKIYFDDTKTYQFRNLLSQYQYEWDDKRQCNKKVPKHDFTSNASDALRYMGVTYKTLTKPVIQQQLRKKVLNPLTGMYFKR